MSVKFSARHSGAGNGCANFMGAWKKGFLSAGKSHVHKIPRFGGGGGILGFFWGGGGECQFYFYGREDFSDSGILNSMLCRPSALYNKPRKICVACKPGEPLWQKGQRGGEEGRRRGGLRGGGKGRERRVCKEERKAKEGGRSETERGRERVVQQSP